MKIKSILLLVAAVLLLPACKKDDPKLDRTAYSLFSREVQKLEGEKLLDVEWESDDEFVARANGPALFGLCVGQTTIRSVNHGLSFAVEVKPRYNTYVEPCMEWGISKSEIKERYGEPWKDEEGNIAYLTTEGNTILVLYSFDDEGLNGCGVICLATMEEVFNFLEERYSPLQADTQKERITFAHVYGKLDDPKVDCAIAAERDKTFGGMAVAYSHVSLTRGDMTDHAGFDEIFNKLRNIELEQ